MNEDLKNVKNEDAESEHEARLARIRKMRGWQRIDTATVHSHADVGGDVDYGSGHSGWNR